VDRRHPNLEDPEGQDGWSRATQAGVMVFDQFTGERG